MDFKRSTYERLRCNYVERNSKEALIDIRKYLDMCGFTMPCPNYHFSMEDKRTWKYIDVVEHKGDACGIENPNFKYKGIF